MAPADTSKNIVGKNGAATTTSCFSSSTSNSSSTTSGTGSAGGGGGRHGLMKKGPWTAAEDAILMEYVKKHGEGNWNAVQRNSGLMRCGKSCRLRWANHLRPNLKKGAFCSEEEALIVELHSKLGNKWARMAAQLPGRTDNEIKNYWNTRLKRRQRAGLPIYPHDVNGGKTHTSYHRYQQENNIQAITNINNNNNPSSSLLSPPAPPALSSPAPVPVVLNPGGYRTPLSLFDIFSPSVTNNSYLPNPTNCTQPFKFFQENNNNNNNIGGVNGGGLALSLSSPPPHPPPPNSLSMPNCMQYNINFLNFGTDSIEQRILGGGGGGGTELPSIQSSLVPRRTTTTTTTTTTTSSDNNGSDDYNMIGTTSSDADDHEDNFLRGNSGLLEDLIDESQALMTRSEKSKDFILPEPAPAVEMIKTEDNYLWDYKVMEGLNLGHDNNVIQDNYVQDSTSPAHSSIRTEPANMASSEEESNPVDDDFMSLLDNFPMMVPVPDWCNENESMGNGNNHNNNNYSSSSEKENENQPDQSSDFLTGGTTSRKTTATATDHNFDIGACCWKNLPGIYQM